MICEMCYNRRAMHKHHLFSQTKLNRRVYADYIDDPRNIIYVCVECHLQKPVPKLTEYDFCRIMQIKPRTKTGLVIWERNQNAN